MFGDSQSTNSKNQNMGNDQVEVTIRNLPNQAKNEDILQYLSIAGPIKSNRFIKEEERYSAVVVYYDSQSAELCKKYLDDRYYKGRALTIQIKKPYGNNAPSSVPSLSFEEELAIQIMRLKNEEKKMMLGLLKEIRKDGEIFESFLGSRPKIVQALLNRYSHE